MGRPRKNAGADALAEIEHRIDHNELLSDEEKLNARERAKAHVAETRKKKAVDAYFAAAIREEERSFTPTEMLEDFIVDLPEFTFRIVIDGVAYYHGVTYEVPYSKARSMADIQNQAWAHQREIEGRRRHGDMSRQAMNRMLSPNNPNGAVTTLSSMRSGARVE